MVHQLSLWERACSRKTPGQRGHSDSPRHRYPPSRAGSLPQGLHCLRRSEPAREKRRDNAGIQTARVIVIHHRERARSYRVCVVSVGASLLAKNVRTTRAFRQPTSSLSIHREQARSYRVCIVSVGASLLAKNVMTTRAFRQPASSLPTIASRLAPTGFALSL